MEGRPLGAPDGARPSSRRTPDSSRSCRSQEHLYSPPQPPAEPRYRWGMAIDLHRCTGCSACVVACQAENNIPAVGKDEVRRGREMHWLRIDRYFIGDERRPGRHHPAADVRALRVRALRVRVPRQRHRPLGRGPQPDGLQPLRRHAVLLEQLPVQGPPLQLPGLHRRTTPQLELHRNPDVTVRSRGVMEKCTYCVQRIERRGIDRARGAPRHPRRRGPHRLPAGVPTEAIVFGDLNDAESRGRRGCTRTRATTSCCTSWAPGRARCTWCG